MIRIITVVHSSKSGRRNFLNKAVGQAYHARSTKLCCVGLPVRRTQYIARSVDIIQIPGFRIVRARPDRRPKPLSIGRCNSPFFFFFFFMILFDRVACSFCRSVCPTNRSVISKRLKEILHKVYVQSTYAYQVERGTRHFEFTINKFLMIDCR